ncbi:MAG TPA: hypothetical protein VJS43_05180 [Candidatus Acidoferrales bacterium]|nr:hypothetical protein [Candidatus Acidoferrales bacterium]
MKNKTSSKRKKAATKDTNANRAPSRKKRNEISSDTSLQSSLTSDVGLAPSLNDTSSSAGQAGDVQGISNIAEADAESVEELLEDGQALEAEVVSGVEGAPDEREVPARGRLEDEMPHSFDERDKI